jgi:predicted short-subunit dehydrogenase-like oxidoreductase (DUF2520 family)
MKYLRIGFAGSGNVAWHLAQDLEKAGHFVPVIYSRNQENAMILAAQLYDTQVATSLDFSEWPLDLLIVAVQDDTLSMVAEMLVVQENTIVVHTSGSLPMEALDMLGDDYGVLYPLQTFTKEKGIDLSDTPFCIEAVNTRVHETLFSVAKSLSNKVVVLDSEQRKALHMAAVFANNFSNHMLFWAKNIADAGGLDFQLLKPLARETIEKAFFMMPELAQTGPARRGDVKTMESHMAMLENNPELKALYKTLSFSIRQNS